MFRQAFLMLLGIAFFLRPIVASDSYVIELKHPNAGLFINASVVLGVLQLVEKNSYPQLGGLSVNIDTRGLYYDSAHGPNWWSYFFDPVIIKSSDPSAKIVAISTSEDLSALRLKRMELTRENAAALVKKYIRIQPAIQNIVNQFSGAHFTNYYVIGVHYRGTDKQCEAPRVSYEEVLKAVNAKIPFNLPYKIFVATDETTFLEMMKEKFGDQIIATDAHRTTGKKGVHLVEKDHYALGEEAIVDCLLLSRCNVLIRTSSSLSLWSTYFNPDLPVTLLNHAYSKEIE